MNTEKALSILIQAVQIATKRGAFELAETKIIAESVEMFTKQTEAQPEATEQSTPETPLEAQNDDISTTIDGKPADTTESTKKGK